MLVSTDTYPLPEESYFKYPLALALKVNDTDTPLSDVRISTPFGNGSSVVSGHSDTELFQVSIFQLFNSTPLVLLWFGCS